MVRPRLSRVRRRGGRGLSDVEGAVSSVRRARKMEWEISGSAAPRRARRERDILDWIGWEREGCGRDRISSERMGLEWAMRERRAAV